MAYFYDASKKTYTDVPMLDEIVHNLKLIIQDLVIKDEEEANNNETAESINAGELYVSCMDGTASVYSFTWNRELLEAVNEAMQTDPDCGLTPWTDARIDEFVKGKVEVPVEYHEYMVTIATQYYIDHYVEKNNYYRMLNGEPKYGQPDLHIDISYIPKKYWRSFIDPNIDNRAYYPSDRSKYYYTMYNGYMEATRNEGRYQVDPYILNAFDDTGPNQVRYIFNSDKNEYEISTDKRYIRVNETEYIEDVDGEYIRVPGYWNKYIVGPDLYIKNYDYIPYSNPNYFKTLVTRYLNRVPICDFSSTQIALLKNSGMLEKLAEDNPSRRYLNFLGGRQIDYYTARKSKIFQTLHVPSVEELVKNRFLDVWEKERMIYLKRYYSLAYKHMNPFYDKFMIIGILGQVLTDMISEMPEWYIRRDVFDLRTCQYILEAHGVKFFRSIPLKFQIAMVRRLNQLIKYKSTTRSFYDLCDIFGLNDVTIYKHYIVKTNKLNVSLEESSNTIQLDGGNEYYAPITFLEGNEIDGGWPEADDEHYDWTEDKDGGRALWDTSYLTLDDLLARYNLFFLKVPIGDSLDNYIRNEFYRVPYDSVTTYESDPYWDGENDHDTLKYEILKKEFTTQSTKYLSLNATYKMTEYQFQMVYFMNLIMNNSIDCSLLELTVPGIDANTKFKLKDLIIYMYCFATKYYPIQLEKGIANQVWVDNRDPKTECVSMIYNYLGMYLPGEVYKSDGTLDLDVDGGTAHDNILAYYDPESDDYTGDIVTDIWELDGGKAMPLPVKMPVVDGGFYVWGHNHIVYEGTMNLDYPLTEMDIFDPYEHDENIDAYEVIEFDDPIDLDGGVVPSLYGTRKDVYDGGGPVWGYVYMIKDQYGRMYPDYEQANDIDPCLWFKEPLDKWRYPTIDLTDRIDGFNMEADLDELEEAIGEFRHPHFEWCRGYTLRDVLPTKYDPPGQEVHYFEYPSMEDFPYPGTIGNLLQDTSTGKYYMWSWTDYHQVRRVYKYGIQDFMIPGVNANGKRYFEDPQQLVRIYERNKQIYTDLVEEMDDCEDQDELFVLQYVYNYLFTMKWDMSYYTEGIYDEFGQYEYRQATTFHEFIENKNALLYQMYEIVMSESDDEVRMYNMGEFVDKIIDAIDYYLETDALQYIYYFMPSRSWSMLLEWLSLLINFFKSYKTYMLEISANIITDDKYEMRAAESDHIVFEKFRHEWDDTSAIDDEYELTIEKDIEDPDFVDIRQDDRVYFDPITNGVIDINGYIPKTAHYNLDFDGSPCRQRYNTSRVEDDAIDIDGGWYRDEERLEEYDGGKFVIAGDEMGFDLNGGNPDAITYLYNINGGIILLADTPTDPDINGADAFDSILRNIDYDGFLAAQLVDTIYMYLDGGTSHTQDYMYSATADTIDIIQEELTNSNKSNLDAGYPSSIYDDIEWLDESWFAEYELDGLGPNRLTETGRFINGRITTETYSRPFEIIDIDMDGGPAVEADYYIMYTTHAADDDSYDTDIDWDGGNYNASKTSLAKAELGEHAVYTHTMDENGEMYMLFNEDQEQWIDFDGGEVEDRTANDPVTLGYSNRLIKRFEEEQKARTREVLNARFDSYLAASDAERIAKQYLEDRLTWLRTEFDPATGNIIIVGPDYVKKPVEPYPQSDIDNDKDGGDCWTNGGDYDTAIPGFAYTVNIDWDGGYFDNIDEEEHPEPITPLEPVLPDWDKDGGDLRTIGLDSDGSNPFFNYGSRYDWDGGYAYTVKYG